MGQSAAPGKSPERRGLGERPVRRRRGRRRGDDEPGRRHMDAEDHAVCGRTSWDVAWTGRAVRCGWRLGHRGHEPGRSSLVAIFRGHAGLPEAPGVERVAARRCRRRRLDRVELRGLDVDPDRLRRRRGPCTTCLWSGSRFITVGDGGTILTSPDGSSWTRNPYSSVENLTSVGWNGSRFVVWGSVFPSLAVVLTSPDGDAWFGRALGMQPPMSSIAWTGTDFVAVGAGGFILGSPDGSTWSPRASVTTSNLRSVARSGVSWVAVGEKGTVLSSRDGATWSNRTPGSALRRVPPRSGGRQVRGRRCGRRGPDERRHLGVEPRADRHREFALGSGIWSRPVGRRGRERGVCCRAPTGPAGRVHDAGTQEPLTDVLWDGSRFVAVGGDGYVLASPNGMSWTHVAEVLPNNLSRILFTGSQYVAVGGTLARFVFTSPDAVNWTRALHPVGRLPDRPGLERVPLPRGRRHGRGLHERRLPSRGRPAMPASRGRSMASPGRATAGWRSESKGCAWRARTGPPGRRSTPGRPTICTALPLREAVSSHSARTATSWRLAAESSTGRGPARARLPSPADRRPASASARRRLGLRAGGEKGSSLPSCPILRRRCRSAPTSSRSS